jgi:hypothetical protein
MKKPLKATKDRAAVLARLTESAKRQQAGAGERGQQPAIAVKILAAIPAGDSNQKSAMLMTRSGGVMQETGQTVLVRHVGEGSVSAGAIVTPEPCGRLGLCFTRSVQVVRQAVVQHRFAQLVGPVAGEIGTEDTDWEWGTFSNYRYGQQQLGGWFASVDFTELPPVTAPNSWGEYVLKMKPMRFKVHGYEGQFGGGTRTNPGLYSSLWWREKANRYTFSNTETNPKHFGIGLQNTIAEAFHFSPAIAERIRLPTTGIVTANNGAIGPNLSYAVSAAITNYRIWANETDLTGIVATPYAVPVPDQTTPDAFVQVSIPQANYAGQTLEFDLWVTVTVRVFVRGAYAPAIRQVVFGRTDVNYNTVRLDNTQYSLNGLDTSTRFLLEFDANGIEGRTSLLMDTSTETGWAVATVYDQYQLTVYKVLEGQQASSAIQLDWSTETPTLSVRNQYGDKVLYKPRDNAKFNALLFANGSQRSVGTWDPEAATYFDILGGVPLSSSLFGLDIIKSGTGATGSIEQLNDAYYATQPQTITVTKV